MKLALILLTIGAATAADISVTFPALTERQRYGLKFAVDVANHTNNPSRPTNFTWTVATYNRTNVEQHIEGQVVATREAILESYAQQRDAIDRGDRLNALRKKILNATDAQLAQLESVVATNTPAP